MDHYTVPVVVQCIQTDHTYSKMLFSPIHLKQGLPGGNHLLNQWQRENQHVQVYPTNHQF